MPNPLETALTLAGTGFARQAASGAYRGAAYDRLNADWTMGRYSADLALRFDAITLRTRARDLCNNNSSASAAPRIFAENIVGKDGIRLMPRIETTRGQLNKRQNGILADAWQEWSEAQHCTCDGREDLAGLLRLITESECVDGEVLVHMAHGFDNPFGFALELIDVDQLDVYLNIPPGNGQNQVRMGIEIDPWWRPVAYHIWTNHPSEMMPRKRVRILASEILHLYIAHRPRQTRGVTWFAPLLMDLKMLGSYREAELVAALMASAKMGFIQSKDDGMPMMPAPGDDDQEINFVAEPGLIPQLPPGFEFKEWDPKHPTSAFGAFDETVLRSVATGMRLSYMSVSGDLRGTSYGSGRIGMLSERSVFQGLQQRIISKLLDPIYRQWFQMAVLSSALPEEFLDTGRFVRQRRWHPRSFPWIDPKNDIEAASREIAMAADSVTRVAAERGRDIYDVIDERAEEIAYAREKGVPLILEKGVPIGGAPTVDETQRGLAPGDETAKPGPGSPDVPGQPANQGNPDATPGQGAPGKKGETDPVLLAILAGLVDAQRQTAEAQARIADQQDRQARTLELLLGREPAPPAAVMVDVHNHLPKPGPTTRKVELRKDERGATLGAIVTDVQEVIAGDVSVGHPNGRHALVAPRAHPNGTGAP